MNQNKKKRVKLKKLITNKDNYEDNDFSEINKIFIDNLFIEYEKEQKKLLKQYDNFFKRETKIFNIAGNIIVNENKIWYPPNNIQLNDIKMNTWFTIKESNEIDNNIIDSNFEFDESEDINVNAFKVILKLENKQKDIIKGWLDSFREMYNETLKYLKLTFGLPNFTLNWKKIRGQLKNEKNDIVKKTGIKVHDIDYAIKLGCQNYKSALTNLKRGNIKTFRIRYWGRGKITKIVDLEKMNFKEGSIRKKILGNVKGYYNGKEYDFTNIKHDCRLRYDVSINEFVLYVPKDILKNVAVNRKKLISLDPGIRTFMTGITENKVVEIGKECSEKIKVYLEKKDKINKNENIPKEKKKKIEKQCNKKIKNISDELHWKTINYLIKNYEVVLIGNMSPKGIIKKGGNLNKMMKQIALALSFYNFRKRLEYKCIINNTKYKKVDEYYTSKMCSRCGEIDENLGGSKVYKCKKCKLIIGRDYNGSRGIYLKNFLQ
jgi:putative transposase